LSQGIKKVKELKVQDSNIGKGENGNITTNILTFSIKKKCTPFGDAFVHFKYIKEKNANGRNKMIILPDLRSLVDDIE